MLAARLQARTTAMSGLDRPGVTVARGDQVWADPGLTTWPAYLDAVATGYRAGVARVPLRSDPARAPGDNNRRTVSRTSAQWAKIVSRRPRTSSRPP